MRVTKKENPELINQSPVEQIIDRVEKEEGKDITETTIKIINKSKRTCLISENLVTLFVVQLQAELSNHNLYKTFENYYNNQGLYKLAKYFNARAAEEYIHHQWVVNYLNSVNAEFQYPEIPITKLEIKDNIYPFEVTVDKEIETTGFINNIVAQASEDKDWLTTAFLYGNGYVEGKLIPEQSEEMKLSMDALNIAKIETDWLTIQDSIHDLYFNRQ